MTSCRHDPLPLTNLPIGMYHCPDCGVMVIAGLAHPTDEECRFQFDEWEPPEYEGRAV
jgi:hypothetical protein